MANKRYGHNKLRTLQLFYSYNIYCLFLLKILPLSKDDSKKQINFLN